MMDEELTGIKPNIVVVIFINAIIITAPPSTRRSSTTHTSSLSHGLEAGQHDRRHGSIICLACLLDEIIMIIDFMGITVDSFSSLLYRASNESEEHASHSILLERYYQSNI